MDRENVVHICKGILLSTRKKVFAATRMDLEIIILSEVSHTETNVIQYHLYVQSKK